MKKIIIILTFLLMSGEIYSQAQRGEFRAVRFDTNRDTIISYRSSGDWWFGIRGGPSALNYFGELNLLRYPGEPDNPFNQVVQYNSGQGFGLYFGLFGEWLPVDEYWGANVGVNFYDRRAFDSEIRPLADSLKTSYELTAGNILMQINTSAKYNLPIPGLYAILGMDFDLMVSDRVKQRKKFVNTGAILQDQIVPLTRFQLGLGFHIGVGYDVFDLDIVDWGRANMTPYVNFHLAQSAIADNASSWKLFSVKLGLAIKIGKDRIKYDTLKYNPEQIFMPQFIATVQHPIGVNYIPFVPIEPLPSATLDLVHNPILLGELNPIELKETERPKVSDLIQPETNVIIGKPSQHSFPTSSSTSLSSDVRKYLDAVASFLLTNPNAEVRIVGHSDNQGTLSENTERSRARANNARQYLISRGVQAGRVLSTFSGALFPIAPNDTEAGRRQNRRIEIVISTK